MSNGSLGRRLKRAVWRAFRAIIPARLRNRLRLEPASIFMRAPASPSSLSGTLRISLLASHATGAAASEPALLHRHCWVRGTHYGGMEDNDIRGFLDGRFVAAWNQPSQMHVRLGRTWRNRFRFGERELFRVLQRWDGIRLPAGAEVRRANLELFVETGASRDFEVMLYEVKKDWNPGGGGMERNNTSAVARKEVWWNEAARGERSWGLPGVGFASDFHPDADTPMMPLAVARYRPGDTSIAFESARLAEYVAERVHAHRPLLFLLKLSDYDEDMPGSFVSLYSANHGDDWNTVRRPRLEIEWEGRGAFFQTETEILLEYGRSLTLPPVRANGVDAIALTFLPTPGSITPTLRIRGVVESAPGPWIESALIHDSPWDLVEIRIDAYQNAVPIGSAFRAELRDTWVTTGRPESRELLWTFVSPIGRVLRVPARYEGEYRWVVEFTPDVLGRWRFSWRHDFTEETIESTVGYFDVVADSPEEAAAALLSLKREIEASSLTPTERLDEFAVAFCRLQRANVSRLIPEEFPMRDAMPDGGKVGAMIDSVRAAVSGVTLRRGRLEVDEPGGVAPSSGSRDRS